MKKITQNIRIVRVSPGKPVVIQDSTDSKDLYVIRHGSIGLIREEDGKSFDMAVMGPRDMFGEKACLTYSGQAVSAVAEQETVLVIIPQKTVHALAERYPKFREILEDRIRHSDKEFLRLKQTDALRRRYFLFDHAAKASAGEKILERFPLLQQAEEKDCGAACLAMICKHYDIPITVGKIREIAHVTTEGVSMQNLADTAESLGFTAKGIRCTYNMLTGFELPLIVHWKGYHFIVIYGISKSHVWVADPAQGFRKMTVSEFETGWTGYVLTVSPSSFSIGMAATQSPWNRFLAYLKPLKKNIGDMLFAAMIIQVLAIAPPVIVQNILDRVLVHQSNDLLTVMMTGLMIATFFTLISGFVSAYLMRFLVRKLDMNMISDFYKHILSLPISFFETRKTGDIMARFHENNTVRRFMTESSINTLLNTVMAFSYLAVMMMYNIPLTLWLLIFVVPMIALTLLVTPRYKEYARKTFFARADADSLLVETLGASEIVKGMGIERRIRMKWEKRYAKTLDLQYAAEMFAVKIGTVGGALRGTASVLLLWIGAKMVLRQELTIGQLIAFQTLAASMMSPILGLLGVWDELQETLVAMERLGDVLEIAPEQKPDPSANRIILPEIEGNIRCENLYFRYGGRDTPYILKNINLTINAGTTVALVGPSGSGKSTLAKLFMGLYKPGEGSIHIDDYDMNLLDTEYYRNQIAYVMQNNSLFSGTIAENIALGASAPDLKKISEAAKIADAEGFIKSLPMGFEQTVGERGMGLSGGQIQRICIARAMYRDPKILIFDEATSALDSDSESHIHVNIRNILKGRTAVIIAHRLSTIMNADMILVLSDGCIAEMGNHEELYASQGLYYYMINRQHYGFQELSE